MIINGKYYTDAEVAAMERRMAAEGEVDDGLEKFVISAAVGAVTGSTIIGGLVGGSLLGGLVGDLFEGTDDSIF